MNVAASTVFPLDSFAVNGVHVKPSALRLSSVQGESTLQPKVMALLIALAQKPGELWPRADLIDAVWPNGFGSDESLSRLISLLRKTLSSDHGFDDIIKTVPKLGYRLNATVGSTVDKPAMQTVQGKEASEPVTNNGTRHSVLNDSRISLAVLPIESLSPFKERSFLIDGMTRDITAMLSRIPNARVAPYSSARALTGNNINGKTAAEQLNVRYVISGTLTEQGDQQVLRVNLDDEKAGEQIWSKRFAEPLDKFFDLQEQVVQEIATSTLSEIEASEISQIRNKGDFNLTVYELIQKAKSERYVYGREAAMRVISYAERALGTDPDNISAQAILATQLAQNIISGYSDDPERDIPRALKTLDQIRAIAPRDPEVLTTTALVQFYINGDRPQAMRLFKESLSIDPNQPHTGVMLGLLKGLSGKPDEGISLILNAEARAPRHPRYALWPWHRAACHAVKGEFVSATDAVQEAIDRNPNYAAPYFALALYECLLGNNDAARASIRRARQIDARFTLDTYEAMLAKIGYPGSPGQSCDEQLQILRECLGDDIKLIRGSA